MGVDPMQLPIREHTAAVLETVRTAPMSIVIGETGSGKTTQLPQMLLDAGLAGRGAIAVTQPRRVAAISVARRVAQERHSHVGGEVGYVVRFDECHSAATRIKYVTDGTLLRELLDDASLSQYSVVVLDEAHERSLNTDILFALLKQIAKTRTDGFRVVVMSATLDSKHLSRYMDDCPVLTVPGRQFPVEVIHARENHVKDYHSAAVSAVIDIHVHQPPGDILVFFTGQGEIVKAVRQISEEVANLPEGQCMDLMVLPLYAALPMEMQARVFAPAVSGCRRCIVATNIAETSITVDGVVYVVDPGMCKEKQYDPGTGMERLAVQPISRVQATQRAGRAGRTQPGKCFRLFTKEYYDAEMPDTTAPEIQRTSLLGTVLHLKSLPLTIDVLSFDFVDPPSRVALETALRQLYILDALDAGGAITAIGRQMAQMPLEPSLSRALLAAVELGCLPEMLAVASMLSVENIFTNEAPPDLRDAREVARAEERKRAHLELQRDGFGDHVFLLRLWEAVKAANNDKKTMERLRVNPRGFAFAEKVYSQLRHVVEAKILQRARPGRSERDAATANTPAPAEVAGGHARSSQGDQSGRGRESRPYDGDRDAESRSHDRERERERDAPRHGKAPDGDRNRRGRVDEQPSTGDRRDRDRPHRRDDSDRGARDVRGSDRSAGRGNLPRGSRDDAGDVGREPQATPRAKDVVTALRHAVSIGFANRIANRMRMHNGYHTFNTNASAASIHPTAARMTLQDGLLPPWIVYNEFVETTKPYLRHVCAIEADWVVPTLRKVQESDAQALSKGAAAGNGHRAPGLPVRDGHGRAGAGAGDEAAQRAAGGPQRADDLAVSAARARAMVRRQERAAAGAGKKGR